MCRFGAETVWVMRARVGKVRVRSLQVRARFLKFLRVRGGRQILWVGAWEEKKINLRRTLLSIKENGAATFPQPQLSGEVRCLTNIEY